MRLVSAANPPAGEIIVAGRIAVTCRRFNATEIHESCSRRIADLPNPVDFVRSMISQPAIRRLVVMLIAGAGLVTNGCMHRRLTIRSDPPGAAVQVDGEEVGFTPTAIDYTYYGTREITLQKAGYKTLTTPVKLSTPWYQVFPLEFLTDNFAFTKINDRREVNYTLTPEQLEPREFLEDRANNLRSEALRTEMPAGRGP